MSMKKLIFKRENVLIEGITKKNGKEFATIDVIVTGKQIGRAHV